MSLVDYDETIVLSTFKAIIGNGINITASLVSESDNKSSVSVIVLMN